MSDNVFFYKKIDGFSSLNISLIPVIRRNTTVESKQRK
jgi:hypothetical protein